jgi:hypothetical protein
MKHRAEKILRMAQIFQGRSRNLWDNHEGLLFVDCFCILLVAVDCSDSMFSGHRTRDTKCIGAHISGNASIIIGHLNGGNLLTLQCDSSMRTLTIIEPKNLSYFQRTSFAF